VAYKIILIEDDPLIAEDLKSKLISLGYQVVGTGYKKKKILKLVEDHEPDIIIADIMLEGREYDGIDLVNEIYKQYKVPVIYLTANSESLTVKRASGSRPAVFLLKPFRLNEVAINIDLAIENFKEELDFEKANELAKDSIFIPLNYAYQRIRKDDIVMIKADGSYAEVALDDGRKHQVSINLKNFTRQLDDDGFLRVSRKHLVNSKHIDRIDGNTLYLNGDLYSILISRSKRGEILDQFPILKTS